MYKLFAFQYSSLMIIVSRHLAQQKCSLILYQAKIPKCPSWEIFTQHIYFLCLLDMHQHMI